jgi:hypothetical protein
MLPRWHIFLGAVFTLIIWIVAPEIPLLYLALVFLSSFLIDFDHYVSSGLNCGRWRLTNSFEYYRELEKIELREKKKGIKRRGDFHLFHTVEFHVLVGLLSLVWIGFFYIFIGMFIHSMLDLIDMANRGRIYRREFFFFNWVREKM